METVEQLATRLSNEMRNRRSNKDITTAYANGEAALKGLNYATLEAIADDKQALQQFSEFVEMSRLNMCPLIVDSVVDDMSIMAFTRVPSEEEDPSFAPAGELDGATQQERSAASQEGRETTTRADKSAQRKWRDYHMGVRSKAIMTDCLHHGDGYGFVDEDGRMIQLPSSSTYVDTSWIDPWDRQAAYFELEDAARGVTVATLYWRNDNGKIFRSVAEGLDSTWDTQPSKHKRIPVVPAFTPNYKGIYEPHLATIDRINFMIFSRLVIIDKQSFRELWLKGLPFYYRDPDTGELNQINWSEKLLQGPGGANILPGDDSDVKETGATDISPLTGAAFSELKHLAALTSTPLYILDPSSAQQSAEGADLADKVHRMKVRTLRTGIAECLSEMMSLSFDVTGEPDLKFDVVWAPLEDESMASRANTAGILKGVLPLRLIWSLVLQMTPEDIQKAEDALEELRQRPELAVPGGIGAGAAEAGVTEGDGMPLSEDAGTNSEDEMGTFSLAESPEGGGDPSDFIVTYLRSKGNDAPARDVITAGKAMGFTESALKTARTRMAEKVKYERRKGMGGRSVSYWVLIGF